MHSVHLQTLCRYVLWLLGEVELTSDSAAPFAEQLCQVSCKGADVAAIHWTQRADGLMCADTGGHVSMYETLMTGDLHMPGVVLHHLWSGAQPMYIKGLQQFLPAHKQATRSVSVSVRFRK